MIQFSGKENFPCSQEQLWSKLSCPRFLCDCFPGVESVEQLDDRSATFRVRPGFSFLRGTLEVHLEIVDTQPQTQASARVRVRGIGSSAQATIRLEFTTTDGAARVTWSVEAGEMGGLLAAISPGLIQAAAQRVARDTWAGVHTRLGET